MYTVEPLNNGHDGDEHFVHCSEVVPSSKVEMYGQLMAGDKQFVHCTLIGVSIIGGFTVYICIYMNCGTSLTRYMYGIYVYTSMIH